MHTVDGLVLKQQLVVFGNGNQEQNGGDVLEAVNPLLSLGSLTTNVEHTVGEIADDESSLGDTGSLDTRAEHILVGREVVGLGDTVNGIEVARWGDSVSMIAFFGPPLFLAIPQKDKVEGLTRLTIWRSRSAGIHGNA